MDPVSLIVALSDASAAAKGPLTLEHTILREGEWKHPKAPGGKLLIDKALLGELQRNFQAGVGLAKDQLPFHVGHTEAQDDRAAAWAGVRVIADGERPGKEKMVALAHYTTEGDYEKVRTHQYAFVSPTIDFGYCDRESGSTHKAVLRNVALTNYPFIKQMGPARVVNLSELAMGEGDAETVALAFGYDGGTENNGNPNLAGLPSGYDPSDLPNQCRVCARLGNDCPFAAKDQKTDLALKTAAAASGNCPQYVEADGQTPGAGGQADAANASPTAGRSAGQGAARSTARVPMSDKPSLTPKHTRTGTRTMTPDKIKKLEQQVEASRQEKHEQFIAALAETHGLPADSLTAIKKAFDGGHSASVALSELMDGQSVALSENEADFTPPASVAGEVAKLELSDSVVLPRQTLRDLLTTVASGERTQLKEDETVIVDGKPSSRVRTALSEYEGLSPSATRAKIDADTAAGKI